MDGGATTWWVTTLAGQGKGMAPKSYRKEVTHMDRLVTERRAKVSSAWFRRYEEIESITQVYTELRISH